MKKPVEMTSKGVCDLVMTEVRQQGFSSPNGPLKAFAEVAQISPGAAGMFYQRKFPGWPPSDKEHNRLKYIKGKVHTLTRVCDLLGLDLEACFKACGLPIDEKVIGQSRLGIKDRGRGLLLDHDDLDMLKKQVDIIGPVPHHLIPQLVFQFRSK